MNRATAHVNRLLIAKGLRAFGDGYVSLLLPLYLLELGFSPLQVGIAVGSAVVLDMVLHRLLRGGAPLFPFCSS